MKRKRWNETARNVEARWSEAVSTASECHSLDGAILPQVRAIYCRRNPTLGTEESKHVCDPHAIQVGNPISRTSVERRVGHLNETIFKCVLSARQEAVNGDSLATATSSLKSNMAVKQRNNRLSEFDTCTHPLGQGHLVAG